MNLLHRLQLHNYLFWAVVMGVLLLSTLMVLPYVSAIISAYILAFLTRPLFLTLKVKYGTTLAAFFCIMITIVLVVVPISLVTLEILNQVGGVSSGQGIANMVDTFTAQPFLKSLNIDSAGLKARIVLAMNGIVNSILESIPAFVIGLVVTLNAMFYLLCKWDELSNHLKKYLPFKDNDKMVAKLGSTTDAIIMGHGSVSVLEGVVAFIGFSLVGVQASLVFAFLLFIFAFMPGIGTELIWIPLALYYFSIGHYATAGGVLIIGLILWIGIEFYFYTRFVGGRSNIHPFILLVGVLGGITVFGIFGFIIGPLVLVNSIKIIEEAIESRETKGSKNQILHEKYQK
ncbi:MAG: AI-2E family transporter [Candidatus Micrarchaeota archaeon]|nr:AI-2E family transporter [Candidatus Micrarchaeota archaeon]